MNQVTVFCPATIANISCGFDILGLCLENIGDLITIKKTVTKNIVISKITGETLPLDVKKNVAGVAALAMLEKTQCDCGFDIEINKKIKPGSGIGSSAASAAGVVFGINKLLRNPFSNLELIKFAMEGEKFASNTAHADNVTPAILGGFTIVKSYKPLDVLKINVPDELYVSVLHPMVQIKTAESRNLLKKNIPLNLVTTQCGNLAGLICGIFTNDYNLIGRSLKDVIAEPYRKNLIPYFDEVKNEAIATNALGCGISGSGPSIFAFSKGLETANKVSNKMLNIFKKSNIACDLYTIKPCSKGTHLVNKPL